MTTGAWRLGAPSLPLAAWDMQASTCGAQLSTMHWSPSWDSQPDCV